MLMVFLLAVTMVLQRKSGEIRRGREQLDMPNSREPTSPPPPARYPHDRFKRRFYKHRSLFTHIMIVVCEQDVHFTQGNDVANQSSLSKEHKCTSTIRMFGIAYNFLHNYCCMGGPTTYESIKMFCIVVRECFEFEYSRQPITRANILRQININKSIGWLGKFASLDCMHPKVKKMSYFSCMSICEQNE